jgi:hypothetical protein
MTKLKTLKRWLWYSIPVIPGILFVLFFFIPDQIIYSLGMFLVFPIFHFAAAVILYSAGKIIWKAKNRNLVTSDAFRYSVYITGNAAYLLLFLTNVSLPIVRLP